MTERLTPAERHAFKHQGRTIYSWAQTIEEVNIYIELPPGAKAQHLDVALTPSGARVGVKGNPPYLEEKFPFPAKASESFWTVEDGELHLQIGKQAKAQPWPSAFVGHELGPLESQGDQQRLLLERFQAEHPGFDFSGASINGEAPNAATFMGGMRGA